ncbi:hypothetical protein QFZ20_003386 [Flavobacterium sp. W4I14]|nr:hypothetical protein [Flavobacterium sp. W4I14]
MEVYQATLIYFYTIYVSFFSKAGSVLLCRFVPAIRYSPDEESGCPLLSGLSGRVLRGFKGWAQETQEA